MAENSTVARPYARALYEAVSKDPATLEACIAQLTLLSELVTMEDVNQVMTDPKIEDGQRLDILRSLLEGQALAPAMQNFVPMLVDNDRLLLLPEITRQIRALRDAEQGVAEAYITSAFPMDEAQVKDLLKLLEPKFQIKLKPHVTVDPDLIGGVRVVVGDHVLDTSVKAQLKGMREALVA